MTVVVVIGAGPAGLAAARRVSADGGSALVVDRASRPGGQIGRQPETGEWGGRLAALLAAVGTDDRVTTMTETSVVAVLQVDGGFQLVLEQAGEVSVPTAGAVVLATGAREVVTPFPGWLLPGVVTVGAVQSLLKRDGALPWRRIGLAGSGPLPLAVAREMRANGVTPVFHVESRTLRGLVPGTVGLLARHPAKAVELARLGRGLPRRFGWRVLEAVGEGKVERVELAAGQRRLELEVEALAVGSALVPDLTLARQLGCLTHPAGRPSGVVADAGGATSVPGVFAAGEVTGVGGADKGLAEGDAAGASAQSYIRREGRRPSRAEARRVRRWRRFAHRLDELFPLGTEWVGSTADETVVCRCEEVTLATIRRAIEEGAYGARAVKGVTRAGMGYCQGRTCGPLLTSILATMGAATGDDLESRPLAAPVTLGALGRLRPDRESP
jgi:D-hydroxyproline dehydrogenase subunit alpha